MADDDFQLWLGRIGKDRPFRHQLRKALVQSGGAIRRFSRRARRFDGSRIGRGSATGRVLGASNRHTGPRRRRVVVKAQFVRLGGKRTDAAAAHLRYLQRDGTTREGERGTLYSANLDSADGKAFLERGTGDRHQFRFIVAAEDGAEYDDLKPMIRKLMAQAEKDLGTKLDWVAVDHFNTGHPHTAHQPPFEHETGQLGLKRYRAFIEMVGRRLARPDQSPTTVVMKSNEDADG